MAGAAGDPDRERTPRPLITWSRGQLAELASQAPSGPTCHGPVRDYAQVLTMDALANAVAGRSAETVAEFETATSALAGSGDHAVCGGRPLSARAAAWRERLPDDRVHHVRRLPAAPCHVTPEVVPAALAAAEVAGASGP